MIVHRVQQSLEIAEAILGVFGGAELLLAPSRSQHLRLVAGLLIDTTKKCMEMPALEHVTGHFLGGESGSSLTSHFGTRE
jgi:hypothetical protein